MTVKSRAVLKTLFIVLFVLSMIGITKGLSMGLELPYHESAIWIISGAIWAYVASALFDRFVVKRKHDKRRSETHDQLQQILHELGELKNIINK